VTLTSNMIVLAWTVKSPTSRKRLGHGGLDPIESLALPADFDWKAYLKWNPELAIEGVSTQAEAEAHYVREGFAQGLVYKDYELTIRYTACGGLMNQHYSHLSALTLAHLAHAHRVIWPPMQERKSYNIRYHTDVRLNRQEWTYMDASTVWDLSAIKASIKGTLLPLAKISHR
jgi:hypothetical protein